MRTAPTWKPAPVKTSPLARLNWHQDQPFNCCIGAQPGDGGGGSGGKAGGGEAGWYIIS